MSVYYGRSACPDGAVAPQRKGGAEEGEGGRMVVKDSTATAWREGGMVEAAGDAAAAQQEGGAEEGKGGTVVAEDGAAAIELEDAVVMVRHGEALGAV